MTSYSRNATRIISFIQEECVSHGWMIAYVDGISGKILNHNVSSDDIADHLFFMRWWAEKRDDSSLKGWCTKQYRRTERELKLPNGLYLDIDSREKPSLHSWRIVPIHYQEDHLLGLINFYLLTEEKEYLDAAEAFALSVIQHALSRNGHIYDHVFTPLNMVYPTSYAETNGLFLEGFAQLYEITGKVHYLKSAQRIVEAWINNPFFNQYGFFPERWHVWKGKPTIADAKLMKSNTNMIFGLLRYYSATKDNRILESLKKTLSSLERHEYEPGVVADKLTTKRDKKPLNKTSAHAFLDCLVEYHRTTGDKISLKRAELGMKFWISHMNDKGLIPDDPLATSVDTAGPEPKGQVCMNDSHTDLLVVMLKLHELTGKKLYLDAAQKTANAVRHFIKKGQVVAWLTPKAKPVIAKNKTKFLGGMLKGLAAIDSYLDGERFADEKFRDFTRDR